MRKKQGGSLPPKGTGPANPSTKRKLSDKVEAGSAFEENPNANKLPPPSGPRKGKGLMTGQGPVIAKPVVLLYEDSRYALKQLSSIIKDDDYHATKAMGEMGLFNLAQICISILLSFPSCCLFIFLTFVFYSCRWYS